MKRFYKYLALCFIFGISLFFFGKKIPTVAFRTATATSLQTSNFPLMYIQVGSNTINTLHGYSTELNSGTVRNSITPLDSTKTFTAKISENESKVKKLDYEVTDIANDKVIESDTLTAFSKDGNYKTVPVKISTGLNTSTEYGLELTLTTSYSKKIYFYTRIKYYDSDCFFKEKVAFATNFHKATLAKQKSFVYAKYLEPNTSANNTLANVTINSSQKLITWGNLHPTQITECVPTVKEINIETAAISQDYFVSAKTDSGKEIYHVKEFYRLRYSGGRMYLLYFKRTMEALFDPNLTSLTRSEFHIGVTSATDLNITTGNKDKSFAFVRNGSLWYYNLNTNQLDSVFSFENNSKDYLRDYYDQHNIRVLNMDSKGNINFLVYGYMNSGDYEGRVGILLYNYNPEKKQLTERVYLPLQTTYQQLKEDFGSFCYISKHNVFYFTLNNSVYAYNISSKQYTILTKNASVGNFAMLKSAASLVWTTSRGGQSQLNILNLESQKQQVIEAPAGETIQVYGAIDSNIVYGYSRNSDNYENADGEKIMPAYKMIISSCNGDILKTYKYKNIYISSATVSANVVHLNRLKRKGGRFVKTSDDSIQKQKTVIPKTVKLTKRVSSKMLTEKYISLPDGFEMKRKPSQAQAKYVLVTNNTTVHLSSKDLNTSTCYYVYAYGTITASLRSAGKAIVLADKQMGVVMDNHSHIIWERGGSFLSKTLSGFTLTHSGAGTTSIQACSKMLLEAAQVSTSTSELKGKTIMDNLKSYLDTPVNLTGCTTEEVLYFVSNGKPVIAMKDATHAVLITSYTQGTVTWFDPAGGTTKTSWTNAERIFKNAGSLFISFV